VQDSFPYAIRGMHLSFENLEVFSALNLQAFFMDFHHDTSLRSILEDDFISLAFIA